MLIKKESIMPVLGVLLLVGFGGYVCLSARPERNQKVAGSDHATHGHGLAAQAEQGGSQCSMHLMEAATGGQECAMHDRQSSAPIRNLLKYGDELGLTVDQMANLQAMRSDLFQKCGEIQRDMREKADDLKLLMADESTDPVLIDGSLKEQQVLGEDLQKAMIDYNSSTLALLNSDQRDKLTELESAAWHNGVDKSEGTGGYHAAVDNSADCCAGSK